MLVPMNESANSCEFLLAILKRTLASNFDFISIDGQEIRSEKILAGHSICLGFRHLAILPTEIKHPRKIECKEMPFLVLQKF